MVEALLNFAEVAGDRKVRLDIVDSEKQAGAIRLYQHLGFYFIERYNENNAATLFMEKML